MFKSEARIVLQPGGRGTTAPESAGAGGGTGGAQPQQSNNSSTTTTTNTMPGFGSMGGFGMAPFGGMGDSNPMAHEFAKLQNDFFKWQDQLMQNQHVLHSRVAPLAGGVAEMQAPMRAELQKPREITIPIMIETDDGPSMLPRSNLQQQMQQQQQQWLRDQQQQQQMFQQQQQQRMPQQQPAPMRQPQPQPMQQQQPVQQPQPQRFQPAAPQRAPAQRQWPPVQQEQPVQPQSPVPQQQSQFVRMQQQTPQATMAVGPGPSQPLQQQSGGRRGPTVNMGTWVERPQETVSQEPPSVVQKTMAPAFSKPFQSGPQQPSAAFTASNGHQQDSDGGPNARYTSVVTLANGDQLNDQAARDKVRSVVQLNSSSSNNPPAVAPFVVRQDSNKPQFQTAYLDEPKDFSSKIVDNANRNAAQTADVPWRRNSGPTSQPQNVQKVASFDPPMSSRLVAAANAASAESAQPKTPSPPRNMAQPKRQSPPSGPVYQRISPSRESAQLSQQKNDSPVPEFANMKLRPSPPRSEYIQPSVAPQSFSGPPSPPSMASQYPPSPPLQQQVAPPPPTPSMVGPPPPPPPAGGPPPPPPPPGLAARPKPPPEDRRTSTGKKIISSDQPAGLDPRDELMMAIRSFGGTGSGRLRRTYRHPEQE